MLQKEAPYEFYMKIVSCFVLDPMPSSSFSLLCPACLPACLLACFPPYRAVHSAIPSNEALERYNGISPKHEEKKKRLTLNFSLVFVRE